MLGPQDGVPPHQTVPHSATLPPLCGRGHRAVGGGREENRTISDTVRQLHL